MATETKNKKKYTYLTKAVQMPDGTRKYFRAKTQEELDEKVLKAQILVNAGVDICSEEETFGHFAQMWYDLYKKPYLRENSLIAIRYALNQYILPAIGGYRLRDITPMQIQAIMAGLSDKSNSVQSKVLINLRSIFNTAQENGLVAKSPVSNMLKPGGRKTPEKEALTVQESNLLLERVKNPRAKTFLLTALHTEMRRGEIVGLQWEDISSMLVTSFPPRVALPIGSHPDTIPARTHEASLPYTRAATATGTEPEGKFSSLIGVYLLSTAILS